MTWPSNLTHPVNFPCGKKPEYPEKTHDFRQSVDYTLFRKPTTFGKALTILFSHEDWVRVHIKMNLTGDRTCIEAPNIICACVSCYLRKSDLS